MTQTSLVTYVLLLDLDGGNGRLDERVSEVIAREIARSRHGYRLRAQHYLVFGALLTVVGEHELAARALAAHDALGTPTSARTRALIAVARSHLDDHLARAGVAPAPAPEPSDLPALVGRIQTALLGTVSPATRPADEPRRPPVAEPSRGGSRRSAVAGP